MVLRSEEMTVAILFFVFFLPIIAILLRFFLARQELGKLNWILQGSLDIWALVGTILIYVAIPGYFIGVTSADGARHLIYAWNHYIFWIPITLFFGNLASAVWHYDKKPVDEASQFLGSLVVSAGIWIIVFLYFAAATFATTVAAQLLG